MLPNLTAAEILELRAMLRERLHTGDTPLPEPQPDEPLTLKLIRSRSAWVNSRRGGGSGESAITLADTLYPGEADADHPSHDSRTENRFPVINVTSPDKIEITYDATIVARLTVAGTIALHAMNTPYDDGEHIIRQVTLLPNSTNPTSIRIRLRRDLAVPTTPIAGYLVLQGTWGWDRSTRPLNVVSHARHDIGVAARIGPEWVMLSRGQCRGILTERLDAATVNGGVIIPSSSKLMIGELNIAGNLVPAVDPETGKRVVVSVKNFDEHVSASAFTLAYGIQFGAHWEVIPSCSPSAVTRSAWEPN